MTREENKTANGFTKDFTMVDYLVELIKSRKWLVDNSQDTEQIDKVIEKTRNELLKQEA